MPWSTENPWSIPNVYFAAPVWTAVLNMRYNFPLERAIKGMDAYFTLDREARHEIKVKGSRFIGYATVVARP